MICIIAASEFELAQFAESKGLLCLNPFHGKGPSNTWAWTAQNQWYVRTTTRFWTKLYWQERDNSASFMMKTMQSRFNFVKAAQTHGSDIMILGASETFWDQARAKGIDRVSLDKDYDVHGFDSAYLSFVRAQISGEGSGLSEPRIVDFPARR